MKRYSMIKKISRLEMSVIALISLSPVFFSGCDPVDKSDDIPASYFDVENLIEQGYEHFSNGDYPEAINSFNEALERDVEPDSIGIKAYQGLGWTYSRVGNYSAAITNFNFLLSIESLNSGKYPVVEEDNLIAASNPYPINPTVTDTFGIGPWTVSLPGDKYILSVSSVVSYSAQTSTKITVGDRPNEIEPGTTQFELDNVPLSNLAGTGIGTPLTTALVFEAGNNPQADSLVYPVAAVNDLDPGFAFGDTMATELAQYHVDPVTGLISIKPRFWLIKNLRAIYTHYENKYLLRQHDFHTISLQETLEDDSKFPVLDPDNYAGSSEYLISGEFFNTTNGGTYNQCDAFAGLAAGYLAQGDYTSAIRAANIAVLINESLRDQGSIEYPYQRKLYASDTGFDMWNVYLILAQAYFSSKDFMNAEKCFEVSMGQGNLLNASSDTYEFDMIQLIGKAEKPDSWNPPNIW